MTIGWIIVRSHSSGAAEFYTNSETSRWSGKLSDCMIFRSREIIDKSFVQNCSEQTDEIVPIEAYF